MMPAKSNSYSSEAFSLSDFVNSSTQMQNSSLDFADGEINIGELQMKAALAEILSEQIDHLRQDQMNWIMTVCFPIFSSSPLSR